MANSGDGGKKERKKFYSIKLEERVQNAVLVREIEGLEVCR